MERSTLLTSKKKSIDYVSKNFEVGECLVACLEENAFQCQSITFDSMKQICTLHEENKFSSTSVLHNADRSVVYFDIYEIGWFVNKKYFFTHNFEFFIIVQGNVKLRL